MCRVDLAHAGIGSAACVLCCFQAFALQASVASKQTVDLGPTLTVSNFHATLLSCWMPVFTLISDAAASWPFLNRQVLGEVLSEVRYRRGILICLCSHMSSLAARALSSIQCSQNMDGANTLNLEPVPQVPSYP